MIHGRRWLKSCPNAKITLRFSQNATGSYTRLTIFKSKLRCSELSIMDAKTPPGSRPLQALTQADISNRFERAFMSADGVMGAHCVHELWMRGEMSINIERALEKLWARAAVSIPEW